MAALFHVTPRSRRGRDGVRLTVSQLALRPARIDPVGLRPVVQQIAPRGRLSLARGGPEAP
jgi:hypothetical protein